MTTAAPALLFLGDNYGTLASARCLASRGVPVHVADSGRLSRTGASRAVHTRHRSPSIYDVPALLDWLDDFGLRHPGTVLLAANDDLAFLFAQHRAWLSRRFRVYGPDLATLYRILNKQRLHDACERVGIDVPRTHYPRTESELVDLVGKLGDRALLLKPKTQIQLQSGVKAVEIERDDDPVVAFRRFVHDNPYGKELLAHDPEVRWPMVQEFLPNAAGGIYSVAGFIDDEHRLPLVRASRKILQRPRKLGIGLCFVGAPVTHAIVEKVGALCRALDYRGPFELEFVEQDGRMLLIDFNPRIYSQLAFEVARGLPTPWLHYLAATEQHGALADAWATAERAHAGDDWVYTHSTLLTLVRGAQVVERALLRLPNEDWGRWRTRHRARLVDAVRDGDDLGPVVVDAVQHARHFVQHPRSFLRSFVR
jgi:predicted ATP-grasp superfamily ATP-dependent carboligase